MTRATQLFRLCSVLLVPGAVLTTGCSFHGSWRAGSSPGSTTQTRTSGSESQAAPSGGRRSGVRVTVAPHQNNNSQVAPAPQHGSGSTAAPLAPPPAPSGGSGSAAAPLRPPTTTGGSGSAAAPLAPPTTTGGSGSAAAPLAPPSGSGSAAAPVAAPTQGGSTAAPLAPPPVKPEGDRVSPTPANRPPVANNGIDKRPSCRPFTLTAKNGEALRLRVVLVPETAEVRLDARPLKVTAREGTVWTVEIPADASSGTLSVVDGSTSLRCGKLSTGAK